MSPVAGSESPSSLGQPRARRGRGRAARASGTPLPGRALGSRRLGDKVLPQRDPSFYIYPRPPPCALRGGSVSSPTAPGWFPRCSRLPPLSLSALLPLSSLSSPCTPPPGEVWVLPVLPHSRHLTLQWNSTHSQAVPLKPTARFTSEHQVSAETNARSSSALRLGGGSSLCWKTRFYRKLWERVLRRGMA